MYIKEREGTVSVILRPKLKDDLIIQVCVWGQKDGCRQLSTLADQGVCHTMPESSTRQILTKEKA